MTRIGLYRSGVARILLRSGVALALLVAACSRRGADDFVRGHGLSVANLPLHDRAAIYQEAIGGAFQVGDPSLYLLLDPRRLPRSGGYGPGDDITNGLQNTLLKSHIVQGTCEPPDTTGKLAHCKAPLAGYVVRFSDIFQLPGDSVSVNLYVQRYSTPTSVGVGRLRFERIYRLVRRPAGWAAVVEGRIHLDSP